MKYLFIYSFLLITSVSAEYKMGSYKLSEMGEIPKDSLVYPVSKFIEAMKANKVEDCLNYLTEELLYDKDNYSDNFFMKVSRAIKEREFSDKHSEEIKLSQRKGYIELTYFINGKKEEQTFIFFRVKKIKGKLKIYYLGAV